MTTAELFEFPAPIIARRRKPKVKKEIKAAPYSEEFEAFWVGYPRKLNCSKFEASKSWDRLPDELQVQAKAAVLIFARQCAGKDEQYICHAATWLNQRRFETVAVPRAPVPSAPTEIDWPTVLRIYAKTNNWNPSFGPAPDQKGYRGPAI